MSNFSQFVTCRLDFDNGYNVSFEKVQGMGEMFVTARLKGERIDLGVYLSNPGKGDGFFAYLSPEDFAELVYRISKEPKQ